VAVPGLFAAINTAIANTGNPQLINAYIGAISTIMIMLGAEGGQLPVNQLSTKAGGLVGEAFTRAYLKVKGYNIVAEQVRIYVSETQYFVADFIVQHPREANQLLVVESKFNQLAGKWLGAWAKSRGQDAKVMQFAEQGFGKIGSGADAEKIDFRIPVVVRTWDRSNPK